MNTTRTPLRNLRSLLPNRPISFDEAMHVAEHQANRLAALVGAEHRAIDEADLTTLTRIDIQRVENIGDHHSGRSTYQQGRWVITIDGAESAARQRFTIAHEVKHVVDSAQPNLYRDLTDRQIERVCDHFAGCLLMSKRAVYRLWGDGLRTPEALASACRVSLPAMIVRLKIMRLPINSARRTSFACRSGAPAFPRTAYSRSLPTHAERSQGVPA